MAKQRLDITLVERGLVESRAKAQALIGAGKIYSNDVRLDKAGTPVDPDTPLSIREPEHPWVSRGGMKLAQGLSEFSISARDKLCLDVGASTGGFTDVLLHEGASKVYAVDVGHGQLDWKLRQDARVVVLEKTNARFLTWELIAEPVDLIVCDASFISLKTVLPAALALAATHAHVIALIKPQFEVGKGRVGKGGVVRDEALHREVCEDIAQWLGGLKSWRVLGVVESPIKGPKGNTEFLIGGEKNHQL